MVPVRRNAMLKGKIVQISESWITPAARTGVMETTRLSAKKYML